MQTHIYLRVQVRGSQLNFILADLQTSAMQNHDEKGVDIIE